MSVITPDFAEGGIGEGRRLTISDLGAVELEIKKMAQGASHMVQIASRMHETLPPLEDLLS
jgi:hypothetical protein